MENEEDESFILVWDRECDSCCVCVLCACGDVSAFVVVMFGFYK